jgi:hypothetical protein
MDTTRGLFMNFCSTSGHSKWMTFQVVCHMWCCSITTTGSSYAYFYDCSLFTERYFDIVLHVACRNLASSTKLLAKGYFDTKGYPRIFPQKICKNKTLRMLGRNMQRLTNQIKQLVTFSGEPFSKHNP